MDTPSRSLDWGRRTLLMGILNVTPDSFSGDGLADAGAVVEAACERARTFVDAGADILDVGGESTRPGARPVPADEEIARVVPVIRALTARFDVPVSIDTFKARVAAAAIAAGAAMINDVTALDDPAMAGVAAESGAWLVLMHNSARADAVRQDDRLGGSFEGRTPDGDVVDTVREALALRVARAEAAGVPRHRLVLDPGIGFGKTLDQNLELIARLGELRLSGLPVLVGPSRKSFIGQVLDLPADQRVEGTAAAVAVAIARGADAVRVHDVAIMARVRTLADAIVRR